ARGVRAALLLGGELAGERALLLRGAVVRGGDLGVVVRLDRRPVAGDGARELAVHGGHVGRVLRVAVLRRLFALVDVGEHGGDRRGAATTTAATSTATPAGEQLREEILRRQPLLARLG